MASLSHRETDLGAGNDTQSKKTDKANYSVSAHVVESAQVPDATVKAPEPLQLDIDDNWLTDPDNPRTWSTFQKWTATGIVRYCSFSVSSYLALQFPKLYI
ncbi:hypothetical protein K435DRAFT_784515 [Dendrothele bispora CBS 962.96]|uniref:Uncharacterized protein n=1 Tax=Dendrothele bispora (strain CBS 962.96) TaxID=1314807 RepID=A0A4S8L2M7_DENBC|nr:hypothetical protein K435DRAFT_784515 [Dendrothele bispora CBS 962.96]